MCQKCGEDHFTGTCPQLKEYRPKPTKAPKLTRKQKDNIMAGLGLTKVRGAVSGKVYYE